MRRRSIASTSSSCATATTTARTGSTKQIAVLDQYFDMIYICGHMSSIRYLRFKDLKKIDSNKDNWFGLSPTAATDYDIESITNEYENTQLY